MVLVVVRLLVTVVVVGMMVDYNDVWKGVGDEILVMLGESSGDDICEGNGEHVMVVVLMIKMVRVRI